MAFQKEYFRNYRVSLSVNVKKHQKKCSANTGAAIAVSPIFSFQRFNFIFIVPIFSPLTTRLPARSCSIMIRTGGSSHGLKIPMVVRVRSNIDDIPDSITEMKIPCKINMQCLNNGRD
jgi:hypothetical protein